MEKLAAMVMTELKPQNRPKNVLMNAIVNRDERFCGFMIFLTYDIPD
jgi:hypothetical protein